MYYIVLIYIPVIWICKKSLLLYFCTFPSVYRDFKVNMGLYFFCKNLYPLRFSLCRSGFSGKQIDFV